MASVRGSGCLCVGALVLHSLLAGYPPLRAAGDLLWSFKVLFANSITAISVNLAGLVKFSRPRSQRSRPWVKTTNPNPNPNLTLTLTCPIGE